MDFHCIFKGFDEKLRLLYSCTAALVFRQKYPHFSHSAQFADFVCKLTAVALFLQQPFIVVYIIFLKQCKSRNDAASTKDSHTGQPRRQGLYRRGKADFRQALRF